MKKALVVGGSNGIGLAIVRKLADLGYYVYILDRQEPQAALLPESGTEYQHCDLLELDQEQIREFAQMPELQLLFVTAGYGRMADFEWFHPAEIDRMLRVNAISSIQILRLFYDRISSRELFFCGVMGSIAGWLSSPSAAVYAASKAALCRMVESVNIELEAKGYENRILNVSPGSFQGSRFNGGENQLALLEGLAEDILRHLFAKDSLWIPRYQETYRDVMRRYHDDPRAFGLQSYQYKKESGRVVNEKRVKIGYLSGTFDLFHVGHLNLLRRAKAQCDFLIVGVHESGSWKGKETFIPFEQRKEIVGCCRYVDRVVTSCTEDSEAWKLWHFDLLFVGSDYQGSERFKEYERFFSDKGVSIVYFPYTKGTSSTQIRNKIKEKDQSSETK